MHIAISAILINLLLLLLVHALVKSTESKSENTKKMKDLALLTRHVADLLTLSNS